MLCGVDSAVAAGEVAAAGATVTVGLTGAAGATPAQAETSRVITVAVGHNDAIE
jgi:hypothetical protein